MSDKTVNLDKQTDKQSEKPAVEIKAGAEQQPKGAETVPVIEKILEEAPADMFAKSAPANSRPERVKVCKAHIDAFAGTIRAGQTDEVAVATATLGMAKMLDLLETLNASDVTEVLDYLMKVIAATNEAGTKAFDKGYVFVGLEALTSLSTRQHFVRMMTLFTTYAKLRDKSKLSSRCSVGYSLEYVKNENGRKAIAAYFG